MYEKKSLRQVLDCHQKRLRDILSKIPINLRVVNEIGHVWHSKNQALDGRHISPILVPPTPSKPS
jgi:hypothetical protein